MTKKLMTKLFFFFLKNWSFTNETSSSKLVALNFKSKMKKTNFLNLLYFRALVVVLYAFVLWQITLLSRKISTEDIIANNLKSVNIEIDICYPLNLINDTYEIEENNIIYYIPKVEFNETCNFENPLAHYTKNFKSKNSSEIIKKFKECKIEKLTPVNLNEQTINILENYEIDWLLYFGKICVKHKYDLLKNDINKEISTPIEFRVQPKNYIQNFDIYMSIASNENEIYRSIRKHLFKRNCWIESDEKKCLEADKGLIFDIIYFLIKSLESPFVSDCLNRVNSSSQECYENCVKEKRKHYLLTYNKDDNLKLDYSDFKLSKECSLECSKQDCKITAFYIQSIKETHTESIILKEDKPSKIEINDENSTDIYETTKLNRNNDPVEIKLNSFIIKARNANYRVEALPYYKKLKIVWIILVSSSVFYGLDIYGLLTRTTKIYQNTVKKKKDKRQTLKFVIFSVSIFVVSLSLAIICERYNFNFGFDKGAVNKSYFSEIESIKERNISLSVCYNLCEILKVKLDKCDNETLIKKTFDELDKITWNKDDFKLRTSLRNSVKIIPIRHDEFELPVYFRNFRKCFLVHYNTTNVLPHLPLQRKSQIYLKFELHEFEPKNDRIRDYDYFFIEDGDGFNYPKLNSIYSRKSVLHRVEIYYKKDNCVKSFEYQNMTFKKDDLIQECLIRKYLDNKKGLPIFTNIRINERTKNIYRNKKFLNETILDEQLIRECEEEYPDLECVSTRTSLTNQEIFKDNIGNITLNLTPFLYEIRYFKGENSLVVLNRIISILCLFVNYSICDAIKNFACTYLYSLTSKYNFQVIKKFSYLLGN